MSSRCHITTSIIYSNAAPHVGHALEVCAADAFARSRRRALGKQNVTFLTGTDEHGEKNKRAAESRSLAPKAFADQIAELFREQWRGLSISYDYFVRTTDPVHEKFVQDVLAKVYKNGDIYFRDYEGLYCVGCERFYTEKELIDGKICPVHNTPAEQVSEGNYFLKLEKYRDKIRDLIEKTPGFIRPERYRNEALNMLSEPLSDLCITRPRVRLDWGIEVPFDPKYVTWVWFDAFWAYMSVPAVEQPNFLREAWPTSEHFIGKDILKTHAVYWPAMLMSAEMLLFRRLNVHGWVNFGGQRMSKSSGNVASPAEYQETFGPDGLRYFLLREVVYGLDGDFTDDRMVERYNADLANDLGNFASRSLSMAAKYFGGKLTATPGSGNEPIDTAFAANFESVNERIEAAVEALAFNRALELLWDLLDKANKYVVQTSPFSLAKDPAKLPRVGQILANLLEALRIIGDNLEPFMPVSSNRILDLLNCDAGVAAAPFGKGLKRDHVVKPPVPLFPRIEKK